MKDLLVFIGESGSGKNFLIDHLMYIFSNEFHTVSQVSTRPMREGEREGHPYHFVDVSTFLKETVEGNILEWQRFNGWYYGTREQDLVEDKINVLSANPAAARILLNHPDLNTQIVYVKCDDKIRLIRSLEREEKPDIQEIFRRYNSDLEDFKSLDFPVHILINNHIQDLQAFEKIVKQELRYRRTKVDN